ncbi:2-hydroxyacid dehydrogenase [Opitutus sp. GAS368]|uniref:2-hydroxyacid dehydrogenase n=1 Tax=Opitutus sp. GAS368 TaxID=1882749 RepID=UPI00087A62C2|nr:2-hydroxyacid dehydrogenase [Opitutus sp. GAS368]SDS47878.1 Phosphoglycerate dehydrogenase [Opitutus sp. GAS368]
MNRRPLQIAVHRNFLPELEQQLAVPHVLRDFAGLGDNAMAALLAEADVLVSGAYPAAWRPAGGPLRLIHSTGAGVDGIDFPGVPAGCLVCNVYGHQRGVAEQAFMLMLALHKGLLGLDAALRRGNWTPQRPYLPEMRGRRLLVLGLGHIGRELVHWGRFLDMEVTVLTRTPAPERAHGLGLRAFGGFHELASHLPAADFVVVAIPAAEGTANLIGPAEFALMKPEAFIINVGRGPVINEAALYEALRTRRIAGAGLDVWYQYPAPGQDRMPARLPFQELDNVIMTPHKPTAETMAYRWKQIAANIGRLARGEPLACVVHAAA